MKCLQKRRMLSQPHCFECHKPLIIFSYFEQAINDNSTWEGIPLKGGRRGFFLCTDHPHEKYEKEECQYIGDFQWEKGAPSDRAR